MDEEQSHELVVTPTVEQTQLQECRPNYGSEIAKVEVLGRIKGAISVARDFPRDEPTSLARIISSVGNRMLAEKATYQYPRGGKTVTGPSIRLAEAVAQRWTNIEFGFREIEQRDGYSVVESFCWDLETNVRQARSFTVRHERMAKKKVERMTDPRDIYEHIASQAMRRTRACILGVIPKEIFDRALQECRKTLTAGDKRQLPEKIASMLAAFEKLGVRQELVEKRLKHEAKHCNEEELFELGGIINSMTDRQTKRSDWFDVPTENSDKAEELTGLLEAKGTKGVAAPGVPEEEKLPFEK